MSVILRPLAVEDLHTISLRIGQLRPQTAIKFTNKVISTIGLLEMNPFLGARPEDRKLLKLGIRFFAIEQFRNYVIVYRPSTQGVEILRILDGRRDLGLLADDFI